jgi:hypothetical protein
MSDFHLLDEYLIVFRDEGRRHMACRIELERRLAELDRLRAIEAATRKLFTRGWRCNGPMHVTLTTSDAEYDAVMAALAAKETL